MSKVKLGIFEMFKIYSLVGVMLFVGYCLLNSEYALMINLMLMLILFLGMIKDESFMTQRKILFMMMCLMQVLVYVYLESVPLLLFKDLFWFSVVLTSTFMWHVLMLNWLMSYYESSGDEYKCYLMSSMSLLTSLTWVKMVLLAVLYIRDMTCFYYQKLWGKEGLDTFLEEHYYLASLHWLMVCMTVTLLKVNDYFMKTFSNYSMFLLGQNEKIKFDKKLLKMMVMFMMFLTFSMMLQMPRLYMIWVFYILYSFMGYLKYSWNKVELYKNSQEEPFNMMSYLLCRYAAYYSIDVVEDMSFVKSYLSIYESGLYMDYFLFLEYSEWSDILPFYVLWVLDLFIYKKDHRVLLYSKYLLWSHYQCGMYMWTGEQKSLMKKYDLKMTSPEWQELLYPGLKEEDVGYGKEVNPENYLVMDLVMPDDQVLTWSEYVFNKCDDTKIMLW